ncbi:MAG: hypothetical protein IH856_02760 [Deltaproteobacteria bacterium]|nr:hypothetical protein [Deltaproteobacteria bacterium]
MVEYDEALETSAYFYDPADIRIVDGLYVIDSKGKEKLEEKQKEMLGE